MSLIKVARNTVSSALFVLLLLAMNGEASAAYNFVQNGSFTSFTAVSGSGNSPTSPTQGQLGAWINSTGWSTSMIPGSSTTVATNLVFAANTSATSESGSQNVTGANTAYYLYGNSPGKAGIVSPTGGGFVALDCDSRYSGAITQIINGLTVGTTYYASFDMAGAQQTGNSNGQLQKDTLTVNLGSVTSTEKTAQVTNQDKGFTGWTHVSMTFTATSSTETLSFLASSPQSVPPYILLSDVSLAVPEPSSIALVTIGLVGALGVGLRKRLARTSSLKAS